MRRKLSSTLFALSLSLLLSCAHTPDVLVCTEINMQRGWCTKTITDEEFFVDDAHPYAFNGKDKMTWWEIRPYMIFVPVTSWVEIKTYIIDRCKTNPQGCADYIGSWDRKIKDLDGNVTLP